jgi:oxygen-independent coproporphyrinogen-3 oxidase
MEMLAGENVMKAKPARAGLYVHFPFCRRKCPYCHFVSRIYDEKSFAAWREGLALEASRRAGLGWEFDTLYLGGGTPSILSPSDVEDLRAMLAAHLKLAPVEFTIEANPSGDIDEAVLAGWIRAGVTRLSVGVQSFDDRILAILGRDYSAARARDFIRRAGGAGFAAIGLDLMVGVPGESRDALDKTLDEAAALSPDHASLYILENVEGLPFEAVVRADPVDDDEAADAFEAAAVRLESMGLRRYEISNFARPGRECRHNLKYWRSEPFLGLGPSAGSRGDLERWTNLDSLEGWLDKLRAGEDSRQEIVALGRDKAWREALVVGLRLVRGIDLEVFRKRFGIDVGERFAEDIEELRKDGFLIVERGTLRIPENRQLVSNRILSCFVE